MFRLENDTLIFERRGETVRVQAVGKNGLRVRATPCGGFRGKTGRWTAPRCCPPTSCSRRTRHHPQRPHQPDHLGYRPDPHLPRRRPHPARVLPHVRVRFAAHPSLRVVAREFKPVRGGDYELCLRFESNEGEKLFGMGQYQQPQLDLKGCLVRACPAQFAVFGALRPLFAGVRLFVGTAPLLAG